MVRDQKHVEPFGVHVLQDVQLFCVHYDEKGVDVVFGDHYPEVLLLFCDPVFRGWFCHNLLVAFPFALVLFVFQALRHVQCLATPWKSWL